MEKVGSLSEFDKDLELQVELLKEFVKSFKQKLLSNKTINIDRLIDYNEKISISNERLITILEEILKLEKIENIFISELLIKNAPLDYDAAENINVKNNFNSIRTMLLQLRELISTENNAIKNLMNGSSQYFDQYKELLRSEIGLMNEIKKYYLNILRNIRADMLQHVENKPLISIIIPAYNEEKYLPRCLASLARQKYPNKEIIVCDNNSTDRTRDVVSPYTSRYIFVREQGVSRAKNAGAANAKGKILVFLDADCVVYEGLLDAIYNAFLEGYNCGKVIDLRGDVSGVNSKIMNFLWRAQSKLDQYVGYPSGAGACTFVNRDLFFKVGGFPEDIKTMEDRELTKKLKKQGRFLFFDSVYVVTSMRRYNNRNVLLINLMDGIMAIFPKMDREWVR
jgi:hypothetical protein